MQVWLHSFLKTSNQASPNLIIGTHSLRLNQPLPQVFPLGCAWAVFMTTDSNLETSLRRQRYFHWHYSIWENSLLLGILDHYPIFRWIQVCQKSNSFRIHLQNMLLTEYKRKENLLPEECLCPGSRLASIDYLLCRCGFIETFQPRCFRHDLLRQVILDVKNKSSRLKTSYPYQEKIISELPHQMCLLQEFNLLLVGGTLLQSL